MARRKRRPIGACHLCGEVRRLSFEHVPPQSAYNRRPVLSVRGRRALDQPVEDPEGTISQRGAGAFTLCESCNPKTGAWYGAAFAALCHQAAVLLLRSGGEPQLFHPYSLHPLRVLKQIVTMFFSVNTPHFQRAAPELAHFVLEKERRYLLAPFRVFAYHTVDPYTRLVGWGVRTPLPLSRHPRGSSGRCHLTEITFPPLGYVMTRGTPPPHPEQCEITRFGGFGYDDFCRLHVRLPLLDTISPLPGDYRNREQYAAARPVVREVPINGKPSDFVIVVADAL